MEHTTTSQDPAMTEPQPIFEMQLQTPEEAGIEITETMRQRAQKAAEESHAQQDAEIEASEKAS